MRLSTVNIIAFSFRFLAIGMIAVFFTSCGSTTKMLRISDLEQSFPIDSIISAKSADAISMETLIRELGESRVIYVGERHTNKVHHQIQLKVIQALFKEHPDLSIGMEMFDHTYQPVLDLWSENKLDEKDFIKKTHWYANWRYDFNLYREILSFIKDNNIPLIGLNIPFHIPPKIAAGGLHNLLEDDSEHLPEQIDTGITPHRKYLENVFKKHSEAGLEDFEPFYEAQCAWEDAMAEAVANRPMDGPIAVIVGNGHIIHKFGIPNRAYDRNPEPFKTIYLAPAGDSVDLDYADYIWATPETRAPHRMRHRPKD